MSSLDNNRFTYLTADDHQRWLWFTHIYFPVLVLLAGLLRIRRKIRRFGLDDGFSLLAHVSVLLRTSGKGANVGH